MANASRAISVSSAQAGPGVGTPADTGGSAGMGLQAVSNRAAAMRRPPRTE